MTTEPRPHVTTGINVVALHPPAPETAASAPDVVEVRAKAYALLAAANEAERRLSPTSDTQTGDGGGS